MDRLRIAVRIPDAKKIVYTTNNIPECFRPYVEKAMEDLRNSEDPTIAVQYLIKPNVTLGMWYKPEYVAVPYEPESWPYKWSGMPARKLRKVWERVWPK